MHLFSQSPQRMSYQAVIRNSSNALVTSKEIGMRVSILQGTTTGQEVYKEIYNPNPQTNANGLVSIEIGGGIPITGTFPGINWANGPYFIKTETDPTGGTNYTISGTSQLLSVPYALYAGNVVNSGGKPILFIQGDLTNEQVQAKITAELGLNTQQVVIQNCNALTTLDLSALINGVSVQISENENLQSINLSKLETLGFLAIGNCFSLNLLPSSVKLSCYINGNPLLTSFSLPTITKAGNIGFSDNITLSSLSFPALQTAESISMWRNTALSTLSFSALQVANGVTLYYNYALTTVNMPSLQSLVGLSDGDNGLTISGTGITTLNFQQLRSVESISINSNTSLSSVSFPALTTSGEIGINNNVNLSSIQLPVWSNRLTQNTDPYIDYDFSSNKISSSQINTLLNKLVNLTPSFSTAFISLNGQNPPAPPTGQGLIDKANLQSRENQVQTD